jgi:hypothetical protein
MEALLEPGFSASQQTNTASCHQLNLESPSNSDWELNFITSYPDAAVINAPMCATTEFTYFLATRS